jgi:hypothetical protein
MAGQWQEEFGLRKNMHHKAQRHDDSILGPTETTEITEIEYLYIPHAKAPRREDEYRLLGPGSEDAKEFR